MRRLNTLKDCRRFLQRIINETYSGDLEASLLGRLANAINILAGCIKDSDIEARLQALEELEEKKT